MKTKSFYKDLPSSVTLNLFCKMTNLSPEVHCDTFKNVHLVSPLLHAYEFITRANNHINEYEFLEEYARNRAWHFNLSKIKSFLKHRENAIVITCPNERIEWVNKGFTRMTGYGAYEAIGKFPNFLQGIETSQVIRKEIREKLAIKTSFSGEVLNYRKDGEQYLCKVDILPIFNNDKVLCNFIALEREVN